ncbi:putative Glycosyltransferase family 34 protein [Seiridium cardinale]
MQDLRVTRVAKVICIVVAVWALIAWIPGRCNISQWHSTASSSPAQNDQFHSTQLFLPSIQGNRLLSQSSPGLYSKIAKVAVFAYSNSTQQDTTYENALRSHKTHNDRYGYLHHVLRRTLLSVQYSKPAYVLSVILQELVKPPSERLEWLVWHDADLVLMNSEIPLEVFLPPANFDHIHLIVTNDLGGLNSGVFFIRVNEWAVSYLTASISYKSWDPNFPSMNEEQAIMDAISQRDPWKSHVMHVPQRWFNSYEDRGINDELPPEWNWYTHSFKPGYLLIHFPGTGSAKTDLMREWMSKKAEEPKNYNVPFSETTYPEETAAFWEHEAPFEAGSQRTFWHRLKVIQYEGPAVDHARDQAVEEVTSSLHGEPDKIEAAVKAKVDEFKKHKIDHLRAAVKAEAEKSLAH